MLRTPKMVPPLRCMRINPSICLIIPTRLLLIIATRREEDGVCAESAGGFGRQHFVGNVVLKPGYLELLL
jgi:hypothetical protein